MLRMVVKNAMRVYLQLRSIAKEEDIVTVLSPDRERYRIRLGQQPNKDATGGIEDKQGTGSTNQPEPVVIAPPSAPPPPTPEPEPLKIRPAAEPPKESPRERTTTRLAYVLIISFFVIAGVQLIAIFSVGGDTMVTKTTTAIEWLKGVSAYLAGLISKDMIVFHFNYTQTHNQQDDTELNSTCKQTLYANVQPL